MKMKRNIASMVLVVGLLATACSSSSSTPTTAGSSAPSSVTTDSSGPGTTHVLPVPSNPITNSSTQPGLEVVKTAVENNVDPVTNKDLSDRLQISLKNTSTQPMSNLEIYYSMADSRTGQTQGYYQKLDGFSLAPGATGTVYFDNETAPGHYPENLYSLYRTSKNEVVIDVEVSAAGYAVAKGQAKKGAGTGEVAGE